MDFEFLVAAPAFEKVPWGSLSFAGFVIYPDLRVPESGGIVKPVRSLECLHVFLISPPPMISSPDAMEGSGIAVRCSALLGGFFVVKYFLLSKR